jgi:DNA-binding transcriptional LysR family regulator
MDILFMKWNTDDLPVFVAVGETMGIRSAAMRLGMPVSTVSRTLSRLEDDRDLRLFERNTRQFRLTAEGEIFLQHAQTILDHVNNADEALSGLRHSPTGTLKLSLPMAFGREVIGGRLAEFSRNYPDITVQVMVTSHPVNIMREDLDVAFVVGPIDDSSLIAQTISDTPLIWVCSQDYAQKHRMDDKLSTLKPHLQFCERRYQMQALPVRSPSGRQILDTSQLTSINDPVILRDIVLQEGGVALLPELYCRAPLRAGRLVQVCRAIVPDDRARVTALTPSRRLQPQKARVFIAFVKACLADYASP